MITDSNDHDMMDNYDENKEIASTINSDKEDNENESKDDRDKTNEEASDEEEIINQPLNNKQMSHFVQLNEFVPYFSNITESLFFYWMQKHHISTQAYDELVDIISNSQRFRKYRQRESREVKRPGRILAIIQQNGQLKIKIQQILIFEDLLKNLQSNDRRQRSQEGKL
ncbi:hypothetical protein GLOIN_2v1774533 [Rhizophagus clarus]|uniref:Uncharacterized protein n=1 Tax=Rhizophagus clarus TaxID=94130 RepID=A0A8H3MDE8_9GLOM|nr:hypothetical protein GLOIN_2v1774533 [Rhizophagus clarus]